MTSNASPSGRASGGWPRGTPYGRLSPDSHCNIFDPGEGDDDGDEIETLREANAEIQNLKQRLPVPTWRVLDAENALINESISMARFVSFVPPTHLSSPMSVLLPRLQHLPSLVTLSRSITLLSTTLPLLLKTSRSSVASMRPSAKPISIATTPSPTLLARVPPTTIFPTRTDSHV